MNSRGMIFLVTAARSDGGMIKYRTTDKVEALAVAARFGVSVTAE